MTEDRYSTLVDSASRGDEPALDELLVQYLPMVEAFVQRHADRLHLRQEELGDLVQTACREALQGLRAEGFEYQGRGQFVCWLQRVVQTKLIQRRRFHLRERRDLRRVVQHDGEDPLSMADLCATFTTPSEVALRQEEQEQFAAAFEQLPEDYQQAIFLNKVIGLSHAEVGRELGRSEIASRQLLHRAKARLMVLVGMKAE